uniref:DUF3615 domain-containing protein n=1 Tax=Oryza meridionalis TaxID=40149 RepID=A0A0E0FD85_9ORYZ
MAGLFGHANHSGVAAVRGVMDEEVVSAGSPLKASSSPPPLSSFGIWSDQRKSPRLPWWKQQFISESEEDDDEVMPPASYVHPKPAALAHFLATVLPAVVTDAASVLAGKASLSSSDIARLSAMLAPSPLPDEPPQPPLRERSPKIIRIINDRRNNLRGWYKILLQLANAACASMPNKPGNNMSFIPSMDHNERAEYIHINFMASPSSCQCLQAFPVCFFAEVLRPPRFKYHEAEITLCCIVQPSPNDADSCHGCLIENHRIDHPEAGMRFCGKMDANGDGYGWDWPSIADVEYRFFDPDKDVGLVEYLDGVITDIKARIRALSTRDEDDSDEDSSDDDISGYSMRFV